jgi:hypothetical protein
VHFDPNDSVALTRLATPALDVKREATRPVATHPRIRQLCEQLADMGEQSGIGRRIRSRGAPDRTLIDVDHLIEMLQSFHRPEGTGAFTVAGQALREGLIERIKHQ